MTYRTQGCAGYDNCSRGGVNLTGRLASAINGDVSRKRDLVRFYLLLDRLEQRLGGKRELADCTGKMGWPTRGVYFFFEDGEARSDTGEGMRVVRVGTHAVSVGSKATLWQRLKAHRGTNSTGGGNHRGSIFRLLVGKALADRHPELAVPTWDNNKSSDSGAAKGEHVLEVQVSQVIRAMPFLWLEIDDPPSSGSLRGYVEANSIGLLSNWNVPPLDPASRQWLGHRCPRPLVRGSGLWNQRHVEAGYDPAFLATLEDLISRVRGG